MTPGKQPQGSRTAVTESQDPTNTSVSTQPSQNIKTTIRVVPQKDDFGKLGAQVNNQVKGNEE